MESNTPPPIPSSKPQKEHAFALNDVVCMSCGGPKMTVTYLMPVGTGDPMVVCTWFDARGRLNSEKFHEMFLRKVRAEHY